MREVRMVFSGEKEKFTVKRATEIKNQIERKKIRRLRLELEEMSGYCHALQCENIRLREFIQSLFEEVYPERKPEDLSLLTMRKK